MFVVIVAIINGDRILVYVIRVDNGMLICYNDLCIPVFFAAEALGEVLLVRGIE